LRGGFDEMTALICRCARSSSKILAAWAWSASNRLGLCPIASKLHAPLRSWIFPAVISKPRPADLVGQRVDFGRLSAARAADGVLEGPLFLHPQPGGELLM